MRRVIVWPSSSHRGRIPARDLHFGDAGVGKDDTQERHAFLARRGRHDALEEESSIGAEVLNGRTVATIAIEVVRPAPIRLIDVSKDRAEPFGRCRLVGQRAGRNIGPDRHKELHVRDGTPIRTEQPLIAEWLEYGDVALVGKVVRHTLGGRLDEARPWRREPGAAIISEALERRRRRDGVCRGSARSVPVDLPAPIGERPGCIAVVRGPERGPILVNGVLNRGDIGPGGLKHSWRHEGLGRTLLGNSVIRSATCQGQSHPEYHDQLRRSHLLSDRFLGLSFRNHLYVHLFHDNLL